MITLREQIQQIANNFANQYPEVANRYLERLMETADLTRDEKNPSHFCVYFLPFNPKTKQVFFVHHKKSGLWLSPGGHIDKGELLLDALNREIKEELGVADFFSELPKPFLISITPIDNTVQPCKEHFDIWFLLETEGTNFHVNPHEFYNTKWISLNEAKNIITDEANLKAIKIINQNNQNE
jgi:8-oxo-dGTP pyrophosphatase MutT (NUDIX family)